MGDLGGVVVLRLFIELNEALFCSVGVVFLSWLKELELGVLFNGLGADLALFGKRASPAFDLSWFPFAGEEDGRAVPTAICREICSTSFVTVAPSLFTGSECSIEQSLELFLFAQYHTKQKVILNVHVGYLEDSAGDGDDDHPPMTSRPTSRAYQTLGAALARCHKAENAMSCDCSFTTALKNSRLLKSSWRKTEMVKHSVLDCRTCSTELHRALEALIMCYDAGISG